MARSWLSPHWMEYSLMSQACFMFLYNMHTCNLWTVLYIGLIPMKKWLLLWLKPLESTPFLGLGTNTGKISVPRTLQNAKKPVWLGRDITRFSVTTLANETLYQTFRQLYSCHPQWKWIRGLGGTPKYNNNRKRKIKKEEKHTIRADIKTSHRILGIMNPCSC